MEHAELESLLGAFALDATDPDERGEIERHLLTCPSCRAELQAHREVAAALGDRGAQAPADLWDRIAASLHEEPPPMDLPRLTGAPAPRPHRARRRSVLRLAGSLAAAALVAAVVLLSLQVAHLGGQADRAATGSGSLQAAARAALAGPHQVATLTSAGRGTEARVVITPGGEAYWTGSTLRPLPADRTYQLWGLARGQVVSLGLVGPDPTAAAAFRLQANVTRLMVTAEPEGGTAAPTTPVLLQTALAPRA